MQLQTSAAFMARTEYARNRTPASSETKLLVECGLRPTAARVGILQLLEEVQQCEKHLSVDDIYRKLMYSDKCPSLTTIYRVLAEFERCGVVARHHWQHNESAAAMFELTRRGRHDHLVCVESGSVIEFNNAEITLCLKRLSQRHNVELVNYNLIVYTRPRSA